MTGRTGAGFLPAAAMVALLALLAGLVAATPQLESKPAIPTKRRMMDRSLQTESSVCPTELATCNLDQSCLDCFEHFASQYDACFEEFCDDAQTEFCCALAGEEENCANDVAFANYIGGWSPGCCQIDGNPCKGKCASGPTDGVLTTWSECVLCGRHIFFSLIVVVLLEALCMVEWQAN